MCVLYNTLCFLFLQISQFCTFLVNALLLFINVGYVCFMAVAMFSSVETSVMDVQLQLRRSPLSTCCHPSPLNWDASICPLKW